MTNKTDIKDEYTQAEIANRFNVSKQYISKLLKLGKLVLNENKKIDYNHAKMVFESIKNDIENKDKKRQDTINKASIEDDATYNQVLIYKLKIEAETKEFDLKKKKNEVLSKDELLAAMQLIAQELKDNLLNISNRLAPNLSLEKDTKKIKDMLDNEIRLSLNNCINNLQKLDKKNDE